MVAVRQKCSHTMIMGASNITSSMVISECNDQAETTSEEDVCFDSHSASDPRGPEAEILTDPDCCFNL